MGKRRLTRAEKQALTRSQVLEAAAKVFPRRGYHKTSVEEVAEQAGLSIGAVYSNFDNKADLFLALYDRQVRRWIADLEKRAADVESPEELARAAGAWWTEFMSREERWLLLELEFWAHAVRDRKLRERFAALFAPLREATGRLIERAADDFDLALPAPPEQLGMALTALCTGLVVERLLDPKRIPEEALGSLLDMMIEAIVAEPAASRAPKGGPRAGR